MTGTWDSRFTEPFGSHTRNTDVPVTCCGTFGTHVGLWPMLQLFDFPVLLIMSR